VSDLEARIKKLEGGDGCSLLVGLFSIWLTLFAWWAGWRNGWTDKKPPFVVERISYEEWKARP
jgi:hypothetical protein